jgi:hypothetical protein
MIVVFDTNVVVEAIFWPWSTARRALTGLASRRFKTAVSHEILDEYADVTAEIRSRLFPQAQLSGSLAWIAAKSVIVEPMPLQKNSVATQMIMYSSQRQPRSRRHFWSHKTGTYLFWASLLAFKSLPQCN